ncbi:MAG: DUF4258 domain-containing protein [Paludibacteraceae bacterium]|nr:DUF4258 domain-containing protein [Paludibacteraceae bacterium]
MIDIENLRKLNVIENFVVTQHALDRLLTRNISMSDVQKVIEEGEIIKQYEDDKPYPSCLILGLSIEGRMLHVVVSHNEESIYLITAYYPDLSIWNDNFKIKR